MAGGTLRLRCCGRREDGYWKIASWKVGSDEATTPPPEPVAETKVARISADPTLVSAATGFLESWLVRNDYDAAFNYLSPKSYDCYNLERNPESAAATSVEDAGRRLRAALEGVGKVVGASRSLDDLLIARRATPSGDSRHESSTRTRVHSDQPSERPC